MNERFFRLGTSSNLAAFALDAVSITALYVVAGPVAPNGAVEPGARHGFSSLLGLLPSSAIRVQPI
jgi:hypothetical protein